MAIAGTVAAPGFIIFGFVTFREVVFVWTACAGRFFPAVFCCMLVPATSAAYGEAWVVGLFDFDDV